MPFSIKQTIPSGRLAEAKHNLLKLSLTTEIGQHRQAWQPRESAMSKFSRQQVEATLPSTLQPVRHIEEVLYKKKLQYQEHLLWVKKITFSNFENIDIVRCRLGCVPMSPSKLNMLHN